MKRTRTCHLGALWVSLLVSGCATDGARVSRSVSGAESPPVINQAQSQLDKIVMPEVDFQDADLVDGIMLLVQGIEDTSPPRDLSRIGAPDPVADEKREQRFAKLRERCRNKKVTLNVRYCTWRPLMDFLTGYAGVTYQVRSGHVTIAGANGEIIVK